MKGPKDARQRRPSAILVCRQKYRGDEKAATPPFRPLRRVHPLSTPMYKSQDSFCQQEAGSTTMESPHEDLLNAYYAAMVRSATSADLELLDETFCDEMLRNESVSKNIFDEKEAEDNISLVARDLCRVDDFVKTESNDGISWTAQAGIFDLDTDLHVDAFKNGSSQDLSKNSPFLLKELTDEGRQYYVSPASCAVDNTVSKSEQPFDVTSFGFATSTKIESEPETPGEAPTVVSNSFERATVTPSPQLFMPKLLSPPPRAVIFPAFSPQSYVYQYLPMLTQPAIVPFLVPQQQQQQQSGMAYWKEDKQVDAAAIVPDTPYKSDGDSVAESLPALQDPVVTPDRNKYFRGRELFPPLKKQEARQHKRRMSEKWWEAMYEKAKKYREIHGHCWIPQRDPKHPQDDDDLRRWARTQRGYYNRLKGGRHDAGEGDVLDNCDFESITEGGLTLDRMERLRKIGFVFEYHSLSWWKNHEEVTKFKKSTGHTRVPAKYESSPALGTWVRTQRRLYLAGKLAADRIEALHRIKFEFHLRPRRSEKSRRKGGA